jgi:hypothetical protein
MLPKNRPIGHHAGIDVEFVGQSSVMYTQGFEHLSEWLEVRLREDVVGVFGLVDEDRNRDRAELLAGGFADHSADRLDDVHHRMLGGNELVGSEKRIRLIAEDLVQHIERRLEAIDSK